jgi:hypothetical protein
MKSAVDGNQDPQELADVPAGYENPPPDSRFCRAEHNRRVKRSSIPLVQLPDPNSALAHRDFSGYHRRLITQRISREKREKDRF